MEISLIIFILILIGVIYLIFKLIKKIIFAILASILIVVLVFGGVLGLAFYDVNNLASKTDFNVNVYYKVDESYLTGAILPIKNQTLDTESLTGITPEDINPDTIEDVEDDDFVVVVDKETFVKIVEDKSYSVEEFSEIDLGNYDLSLTKSEIITILESEDGVETIINILFDKNDLSSLERSIGKPVVEAAINQFLQVSGLTLKSAVFLAAVSENIDSPSNTLVLIESYKGGDLEIYPDRFTFKLIKMLPAKTVASFIPQGEN